MNPGSARRIKWMEPWKHSVARCIDEYARVGVFRPRFWIRPIILSALAVAIIVSAISVRYPYVRINYLRLIAGLFVVPMMLVLQLALAMLLPAWIEVRDRRIAAIVAGVSMVIRKDHLLRLLLNEEDPDEPVLYVQYLTRRKRTRDILFAVSPRVDRTAMREAINRWYGHPMVGARTAHAQDHAIRTSASRSASDNAASASHRLASVTYPAVGFNSGNRPHQ